MSQNHKRTNFLPLMLLIVLGILMVSCGVPRVSENTLSDLVKGNSSFAFNLYQAIRMEEGNLFYSPYSISTALAMTYAGARNETEKQIAEVLNFALPQDQLHRAFRFLDFTLKEQNNQAEVDFALHIANSIWGQDGFSYQRKYLNLIAKNYGTELRTVDFIDDTNRERARLAINNWVNEQTEGKIENLFPQGILSQFTRLVLANAVYFKAEWEDPFLDETKDREFYLLDNSTVTVPMMTRRADGKYGEGTGYQAVEIPYKGERMRMVILLPVEGHFEVIESKLDSEFVNSVLHDLKLRDIQLYLPKFEYEARLHLTNILSAMGMTDAFIPELADFSGITEQQELYITDVVHKGYIAVNEKGTEAAAATGVGFGIESMPLEVVVNRPFIFFIYDVETGTILFIGRVTNPNS